MWYVWLFLSLLSFSCFGREDWLCTEDSSQIQGDQILACGVGEDAREGEARRLALESAHNEFSHICSTQTLCGEHKFRAIPSRATCSMSDGIWKCYRLVKYEIETSKRQIASVYSVRPHGDPMEYALKYGIGVGW